MNHDRRPFRRHLSVLPTGEYVEQRGVIATAIALAALAASATAGGAIVSGAIGAHAAGSAADKQVAAETNAATIAKQTADADRAFKQRQAEIDWQNSQQTQHANYDQWAAREGRLSSLGGMLGMGPRAIPAFSPGIDPHFDTGQTPLPGTTTASPTTGMPPATTPGASSPASTNLSDPRAWMSLVGNPNQLTQWVQQGLGPTASPQLVQYYVGKIQGQPGANPTEQAGSANYWLQKLQSDPNVTGRPGTTASAARAPLSMATMAYGTPAAPMLTPGLQMPTSPYRPPQPFSFANFAGA